VSDYSKKSWADLKTSLRSPADTPDYMKAKEERDYRLKRLGLYVAAAAALIAAAIKIFSTQSPR
jgi:hypothetical protein